MMIRCQSPNTIGRQMQRLHLRASYCDTMHSAFAQCCWRRPSPKDVRLYHGTSVTEMALPDRHGTTIVCVRKNGKVCMMGDGMVSQGAMIVKPNVVKIRRILPKDRTVRLWLFIVCR